jgi:hypothetical protein
MSETLNNNSLEDSRKRKHEESSDDEDSRKRPNLNSSSSDSDESSSDESDSSDSNAQVAGSEVGVVNDSSNSQVAGSEVGISQGGVGGDSPSNLDPQSSEAAQSPIGAGADGVVVDGNNGDGYSTGVTRVDTVSRTLEVYLFTQRTGTQEEQDTARFHLRNARDAAIEFISQREDRQTGSESPTTAEMRERLTEVDADIRKAGADAVIDEIAGNPDHFVQDYSIYDDTE